jgi:glycosyltransferase involved in cell wall biosynthesis
VTADVTVIIPTFNQAGFLGDALSSIIAQDHPRWRAIVVNNHSTDDTHLVVERFNDPRIEIIDFANHGVIAASRNLGIQRTDTEFLAFLDSDDWWMPSKLSRCLERLSSGVDIVCHAEEWRSESHRRVVRYGPERRVNYRTLLMRGNCLSTSAIIGRTHRFKDVGGFSTNPLFNTAEDYDLWLRLAKVEVRFSFIDDVLGVFRIHSASASSAIDRNAAAEMAVTDHHLSTASFSRPRLRRRRMARSHYSAGRAHHAAGNYKLALRELTHSLWLNPLFPRTFPALFLTFGQTALRALGRERR